MQNQTPIDLFIQFARLVQGNWPPMTGLMAISGAGNEMVRELDGVTAQDPTYLDQGVKVRLETGRQHEIIMQLGDMLADLEDSGPQTYLEAVFSLLGNEGLLKETVFPVCLQAKV